MILLLMGEANKINSCQNRDSDIGVKLVVHTYRLSVGHDLSLRHSSHNY